MSMCMPGFDGSMCMSGFHGYQISTFWKCAQPVWKVMMVLRFLKMCRCSELGPDSKCRFIQVLMLCMHLKIVQNMIALRFSRCVYISGSGDLCINFYETMYLFSGFSCDQFLLPVWSPFLNGQFWAMVMHYLHGLKNLMFSGHIM
jgi:hypothetical protein